MVYTWKQSIEKIGKKLNDNMSSIKNQLDDKANKSEVGTPLVASSVQDMTDTQKIYVNITDGKWYSYNGSTWVPGGIYNSQGIGNGTVKPEYLQGFKCLSSNNVLNPKTATVNKRLAYYNSEYSEVSDNLYSFSDFIDVNLGDTFTIDKTGGAKWLACIMYDSNNNPLGNDDKYRIYANDFNSFTFTISEPTCKKIRVNVVTKDRDINSVMIYKGNSYPSTYVEYKRELIIDWLDVLSYIKDNSLTEEMLSDDLKDKIIPKKDLRHLSLPESYYALTNTNPKLFYKSITISPTGFNIFYKTDTWEGKYKAMNNYYKLPLKTSESNVLEKYQIYDYTNKLISENKMMTYYIEPTSKKNPESPKNIVVLGDSFIQGEYIPDRIKSKLHGYGLTNLNFIGSKTSSKGTKHEGRGGYGFHDFVCPVEDRRPGFDSNPFYNPDTSSLDFKYYLSNLKVSGNIDYMIIHLSVNDYGIWNFTAEQMIADAKTFIDKLHTDYPDCKIILDGVIFASEENDKKNAYQYNLVMESYNKAIENMCKDTSYSAFLTYSPVHVGFDTDYGYPFTMESPYDGSTEKIKVLSDDLHPNECGYYMIADETIATFLYKF